MKLAKFKIPFVCLSVFSLLNSAAFGLNPVRKSEWAAAHPKQLPVESCEFVSLDNDLSKHNETGFAILSVQKSNGHYLKCVAPSLDLGFILPVEMSNLVGWGLTSVGTAVSNPGGITTVQYKLTGFEDKTVSSLAGRFAGFAGGGSFVVGGGAAGVGAWLKKSGMTINYNTLVTYGLKFGIDLRYEWTDVAFYSSLDAEHYNNPLMLFDETTKDHETKSCTADQASCQFKIDVLAALGDYKFVKIDPSVVVPKK